MTACMSVIHSGWRSMSTRRSQTAPIGASISIRVRIGTRIGFPASSTRQPAEPAVGEDRRGQPAEHRRDRASDHRLLLLEDLHARRDHLGQRPLAVAGGQVDRPDRVHEERSSDEPRRRASSAVALTQ